MLKKTSICADALKHLSSFLWFKAIPYPRPSCLHHCAGLQQHLCTSDARLVPVRLVPSLSRGSTNIRLLLADRGVEEGDSRAGLPAGSDVGILEPGLRRSPGTRLVSAEVRELSPKAQETRPWYMVTRTQNVQSPRR